jgi:putative ABC transport system permease protein
MNTFIWKGIIRDKSRSVLPVIVVSIGVFFVVFLTGYLGGTLSNMVDLTAKHQTGHLKVVTRAYRDNAEQQPLDLALLNTEALLEDLKTACPDVTWTPRIYSGGLIDIPDAAGETRAQGPVAVTAYDLLSQGNSEMKRLNLEKVLTMGRLIQNPNEILISQDFADKYNLKPGDTVTFFGTTMYGSMSFANLRVAGMLRFGIAMLDKGAILLDLAGARQIFDMEDAAGEILGFLPGDVYDFKQAEAIKQAFNKKQAGDTDDYAPVMLQLAEQNGMDEMLAYMSSASLLLIVLLVLALSIVLWNTGVLGGLRRYNEFGIRLALGEEKKHIYGSLLIESLFIGGIGSVTGTLLGLSLSLYLKKYGIDYSSMLGNVNMMIDPVVHSNITPRMFYIGFIPGILSMLIGSALAGMAVFKRNTAGLFKELD